MQQACGSLPLGRDQKRKPRTLKTPRFVTPNSSARVPAAARVAQLRRALAFARPYRREVAILLVFTLLLAAVNALEPLALKYVFDHLGGSGARRAIVTGVIALLVCEAMREGATAATNWLTW